MQLSISLLPGLYSSPVQFLYYETPTVREIAPPCGPESGFTQLIVTGANFVDLGSDMAVCVFNRTIMTNATVLSATEILCDTPSILNKHGYSDLPEGTVPMYNVTVSLDGGAQKSEGSAQFYYYREPVISKVTPPLGPLRTGTTVVLTGTGFGQEKGCKRIVRVGHLQVEPLNYTNTTITFQAPVAAQPSTAVVSVSLNGQQFTRPDAVHSPKNSITYDFYRDPYSSQHLPVRGPTNGGTPIKVQGHGFMLHRAHLRDRLWARLVDPSNPELILSNATEVSKLQIDAFEWSTPPAKTPCDALL